MTSLLYLFWPGPRLGFQHSPLTVAFGPSAPRLLAERASSNPYYSAARPWSRGYVAEFILRDQWAETAAWSRFPVDRDM